MLTTEQAQRLIGSTAVDMNGDKIGKIGQVYLDDRSGQPEWISINTGLFGMSESLVPLADAMPEGDVLRVRYTKDVVKDAPRVDAEEYLSEQDESRLWQHYGLEYGADTYDTTYDATGTADTGTYAATGGAGTSGTSGVTDDAMTVSEEQLDVRTQRHETGKVRLRKYVVTDQETVTVPVTREEVRLEREPITDANVDEAMSGPDLTESDHEVTLSEEHVVVDKRTVPKERVRLEKDTVTENRTVTEDVRHEEIDVEGTDDRRF